MVWPSRWAFWECGPGVGAPLSNGAFIAFSGASRRFLRAPREATQDAPDARRTIRQPKVLGNKGGNAPQGPQFVAIAMGTGALAEESKQGVTLLSAEFRLTARMMSEHEFFAFYQLNPEWRIERTSAGDLVIMPPTDGWTGTRTFTLVGLFSRWVEADETGLPGFTCNVQRLWS